MFVYNGDSGRWSQKEELSLTGSSNVLIRDADGERFRYRRCTRPQGLATGNGRGCGARRAAMSQFDLTDDQRQIQEMAQKFTADAITPFAAEWDEKHIFPRDTIRAGRRARLRRRSMSPRNAAGSGLAGWRRR